jgi:hypothetical protein
MEQVDITPVQPPAKTHYVISRLTLDWDAKCIDIVLRDNTGATESHHYSGVEAENLMRGLNTANLSNNSLHKRVLAKLIADGRLSGSITGTP